MENYQNKLEEIKKTLNNKIPKYLKDYKDELEMAAKDTAVKKFISALDFRNDPDELIKDLDFILSLDLLNLEIGSKLPNSCTNGKSFRGHGAYKDMNAFIVMIVILDFKIQELAIYVDDESQEIYDIRFYRFAFN